ncbi:MAG: hypothetical protein J3K34DRAFT_413892 [Monoraphidium minutum]|nr:MAG: hypothetical protein J3K34DRAFT_413892 [Monoraphidium minutum]
MLQTKKATLGRQRPRPRAGRGRAAAARGGAEAQSPPAALCRGARRAPGAGGRLPELDTHMGQGRAPRRRPQGRQRRATAAPCLVVLPGRSGRAQAAASRAARGAAGAAAKGKGRRPRCAGGGAAAYAPVGPNPGNQRLKPVSSQQPSGSDSEKRRKAGSEGPSPEKAER